MLKKLAAPFVVTLALAYSAHAVGQQSANVIPGLDAGVALYKAHCATCHDDPEGRAPSPAYLRARLPSEIVYALSHGVMRRQAMGLSADQIRSLAVLLAGRALDIAPDPAANPCHDDGPIRLGEGQWGGWGHDTRNSRFQPQPGFIAADLPRLKVKWAFALPGLAGEPIPVGDRLFVSSRLGRLFALNVRTGCTYWSYDADAPIRGAVAVGAVAGKTIVYVGDQDAIVYALDATTGKTLWQTRVDDYSGARIVGSVTYYEGRLYVPVTSGDEVDAVDPRFGCCKFRGTLVALDAATGRIVFKSTTIQEEPKPTRLNSDGVQMYGPSGAGIWSAPTIDPKRGVIYVATGNSYTDTPTDASDALVAFDLKTGARKWTSQVLANDAWLYRCDGKPVGNCPSSMGPDFDFSSAPILHTQPGGKDVVMAASKSGAVYAFDPDARGKILWKVQIGKGGSAIPIWGPAVDAAKLYVATAGASAAPPNLPGGLTAVEIANGAVAWHTPAPMPPCAWGDVGCVHTQPAAVTLIPGAVLSGSDDGHMRAYSAKDGAILWDVDTAKTYDGVNGVVAYGGNIDGAAQTVASGILFVNSGNASLTSPHRGDAVLAFTIDGK